MSIRIAIIRRPSAVLAAVLFVSGCAGTSTIPLSQDSFQITANAAPICGPSGAQKVAVRQAAAETIRRGYDRFIITGGQASQSVVGVTPVVVQPLGGGGAIAYGGAPLISSGQGLVVKMFRDSDPAASNALSARAELGPNWQEIASKNTVTCFD